MEHGRSPYVADNDELLLGSHLLFALEQRCMEMQADDFLSIAAIASEALTKLSTREVVRIRNDGPSSLQMLAENVLHARGIVGWMTEREHHVSAVSVWGALRRRLANGRVS